MVVKHIFNQMKIYLQGAVFSGTPYGRKVDDTAIQSKTMLKVQRINRKGVRLLQLYTFGNFSF